MLFRSLQFGCVAVHLDLAPRQTVVDLIRDEQGLVDGELFRGYAGRHHSGLHVLAGTARPEQTELLSGGDLERLLQTAAAAYGTVVVDAGSVLDERTLAVLDAADRVLVATTDDPVAAGNTAKLLETLDRLGYPAGKVHLARLRSAAGSALPPGLAAVAPGEAAIHLGQRPHVGALGDPRRKLFDRHPQGVDIALRGEAGALVEHRGEWVYVDGVRVARLCTDNEFNRRLVAEKNGVVRRLGEAIRSGWGFRHGKVEPNHMPTPVPE